MRRTGVLRLAGVLPRSLHSSGGSIRASRGIRVETIPDNIALVELARLFFDGEPQRVDHVHEDDGEGQARDRRHRL